MPPRCAPQTLLLSLLAVASTACASEYRPANSPRISISIDGGTHTYHKNGKEYPAGYFGGGLLDAVEGNPKAEEEAQTAQALYIGGFACTFTGLASVVTGAVLVGTAHDSSSTKADVGAGLLIAGLAVEIVGLVLSLAAVPHTYDAVAIYNDGLDVNRPAGRAVPAVAPFAPPSAPASAPAPAPPLPAGAPAPETGVAPPATR